MKVIVHFKDGTSKEVAIPETEWSHPTAAQAIEYAQKQRQQYTRSTRRFLGLLLAVTGLLLGFICIVIQGAESKRGVFGDRLLYWGLHAEPSPSRFSKLIHIPHANNDLKTPKLGDRIASPNNVVGMVLSGEQGVPHWPRIYEVGSQGNSSSRELLCSVTGKISFSAFDSQILKICDNEGRSYYFQSGSMAKVLNFVVGCDAELWSQLEGVERNGFFQSHPSSFSVYRSLPLYGSLLLHLRPDEQRESTVEKGSHKGSPSRFPYRILYGVLAICFGASLSYYIFCVTDRYIKTYVLLPLLVLCGASLAYGIYILLNAIGV